jgi:tetratricopeptide (TPR) repeat protein
VRRRSLLLAPLLLLAVAGRADWWADDPVRHADRLLALGREAIARADWDRADELADRLIVAEQRDHARLLRGEALYKQHRPESAFEAVSRVRGDSRFRPDAARLQGLCLLEMGNRREAAELFRFVLRERPDDLEANRSLAVIAYDQGSWVEAEAYLKKVAELIPRDGRPHWTLGVMFQDLSLHPKAEEHFREALARDLPGELPAQVRTDLAASLAEQRRFAEALAELDKVPPEAVTPAHARLHVDCLRSLGGAREAVAQADVYLAQRPGDPGLVAEKGLALLDARRAADAAGLLERALAANPHDRRARDGLRRAYQGLGRAESAAEQERKLAETDGLFRDLTRLTEEAMDHPRDAAVRRRMAAIWSRLGRPEMAQFWTKAARAIEGR